MATKPEQEAAEADDQKPALKQRLVAALEPALTWVREHRWQSAVMGGAVVLLVGAAITWATVAYVRSTSAEEITLKMALDALDEGAYTQARFLANKMRSEGTIPPDELGGPAFVLGAVTLLEMDALWDKSTAKSYLIAARYLEEASDRGFPAERRAMGLYMLGNSLYLSEQFVACRLYLQDAITANPSRKTEIHKMLASAYRNDANPKLAEALDHITKHLADRTLSATDRAEGILEKCRILYDSGQIDECRRSLGEIPSEAKNRAGAIAMQGRLLIDEARALENDPAQAKYNAAIKLFEEAQAHDTLDHSVTPTAMYLIGVCRMEMGEKGISQDQLARTAKLYKDTHEGLAATLLRADLLRDLQKPDESVAAYRRALHNAGRPRDYSNRWVPLNNFRERVLTALEHFLKIGQFELSLKLLSSFPPIISTIRTVELQAETHRTWANSLLADMESLSDRRSREAEDDARRHLRSAGQIYRKLAKKRIATRHYPNDLWSTADNLVRGQDYTGAMEALEEYLKVEARARRARALVYLGVSSLALGKVDESLKALNECIDFHSRDAAVYEARMWGAKAYVEKNEPEKAEKLLRANLTEDKLTPASTEWRDSLFALGHLLHASKKHEEAINKLEEAVARYPNSPQMYNGLYTIGEAYREAALVPRARLEEATIESVRIELSKEIRRLLAGALQYYELLQQSLNRRQEEAGLAAPEKALLRNCYMAQGSVLSNLARYEAPRHYETAIKAYSTVSTRYQGEPIVLEAFVQIAYCYRRLNKPVEARGSLEQAKAVLNRLPVDAPFTTTTNYDREQWIELLDQLSLW